MNRWSAGWVCLIGVAVAVSGVAVSSSAAAATGAKPLYVSASAVSDPACAAASRLNPFRTIAAALACAHNGATIHVGAGQFAGEVTIAVNVTLTGAGAGTLIADPTVPGALTPEITVAAGHTVTISRLRISGADSGGNPSHAGVRSAAGSLTVQQVSISGTVAVGGAGIDAESTAGDINLTVQNSTISGNLALQFGGGILVDGPDAGASTVSVLNSTVTGNQGNADGGGLYVAAATLTSRESTITANTTDGDGGGIYIQPTVTHGGNLVGTLLAANTAFDANSGPDCLATAGAGVNLFSGGHNLIGQDSGANGTGCAGFTNNVNGDQVGAAGNPIDPGLAPLADNGGPTPTRALQAGSPAIGTGNAADCLEAPIDNLDQRGRPRAGATRTCDIGAYDTGGKPLQTLYLRHTAASDPACGAASQANPFRTLAAALACAGNGATIHIGPGQFAGEVTVAANVNLIGAGAATVIADPTVPVDLTPEITVANGRTVTVRNLHISGADSTGVNFLHGGIRTGTGNLTLQQVDISGAIAVGGGGIDAASSNGDIDITVQNSTINGNLALQYGGAVLVDAPFVGPSTLTLVNSTISGNRANANGGGLYLSGVAFSSRESTISANGASTGGGLYIQPSTSVTGTLTGTLLAANTASDGNSGPDCLATAGAGVNLTSGGHNLIGQDTGANGTGCAGFANNTNGDQVGSPATPINPHLGALGNHGGPTPTQALLPASPAIGTGNGTDCLAMPIDNLDQRGRPRAADTRGTCDIGAYDTGGAA